MKGLCGSTHTVDESFPAGLLQLLQLIHSHISCSAAKSIAMSPTSRILMCSLVPVLLCALRQAQEAEQGSAALQSQVSGDQSKWTQCCVTQDTGNITIKSRTFRKEALEILGNMTYAGAYGWKDGFNMFPYQEHCFNALQLDDCPTVQQTLFDFNGSYTNTYARVIEMSKAFLAKYRFKTESYWLRAPACPDGMESATDGLRCDEGFEYFLQFLQEWKMTMEEGMPS